MFRFSRRVSRLPRSSSTIYERLQWAVLFFGLAIFVGFVLLLIFRYNFSLVGEQSHVGCISAGVVKQIPSAAIEETPSERSATQVFVCRGTASMLVEESTELIALVTLATFSVVGFGVWASGFQSRYIDVRGRTVADLNARHGSSAHRTDLETINDFGLSCKVPFQTKCFDVGSVESKIPIVERARLSKSLRFVLNYYETISVHAASGDYDYETVRDCVGANFLQMYETSRMYISHVLKEELTAQLGKERGGVGLQESLHDTFSEEEFEEFFDPSARYRNFLRMIWWLQKDVARTYRRRPL